MLLFFDVETTHLWDFKKDYKDPAQPHIVSAAFMTTNEKGKVLSSFYSIVRPPKPGLHISEKAFEKHGITEDEWYDPKNISLSSFLKLFESYYNNSSLFVGHNIVFDRNLVYRSLHETNQRIDFKNPTYCTMLKSTDLCKIPHPSRGGNKWPSLEEAMVIAYPGRLHEFHNALCDVQCCKDLYFWIKGMEYAMSRQYLIDQNYEKINPAESPKEQYNIQLS